MLFFCKVADAARDMCDEVYNHVHKPRAWLWKDGELHASPFDWLTGCFLEPERPTAGHSLLLEAVPGQNGGEGKEFNHIQRPLLEDCRGYTVACWQRMGSGRKLRDLPPSRKPKDARVLPKHFQPPKLWLNSSGRPSGLMLSFQAPQKGHNKRGAQEEPVLLLGCWKN